MCCSTIVLGIWVGLVLVTELFNDNNLSNSNAGLSCLTNYIEWYTHIYTKLALCQFLKSFSCVCNHLTFHESLLYVIPKVTWTDPWNIVFCTFLTSTKKAKSWQIHVLDQKHCCCMRVSLVALKSKLSVYGNECWRKLMKHIVSIRSLVF